MPSLPISCIAIILCLTLPIARAQDPATPPTTPATAPDASPAPTPAAPAVQPPAEHQIDIATVAVREMKRIAASIEQDVEMLNQKFKLEGNFYKDTDHRVRLQLNLIGLGDADSKMLQVCDGKVLWDFQKVLGMQSYKKREITPILEKLKDPIITEDVRISIIANMGFGGPEAMLSGLRKAVLFDQMSAEKLDGIDVFVLVGTWRDRSGLMGPNDRPLPPTAPLPPYIPKSVRVFVGVLDGWPYKIEMIGETPTMLAQMTRDYDRNTGRPIGQPRSAPKVDPTRITLRYKLLPLTEITPGLFNFEAPADVAAAGVKDETRDFTDFLDKYITQATENAKAEAAKKEAGGEPILKAPTIEIPTAPGAGAPTPK